MKIYVKPRKTPVTMSIDHSYSAAKLMRLQLQPVPKVVRVTGAPVKNIHGFTVCEFNSQASSTITLSLRVENVSLEYITSDAVTLIVFEKKAARDIIKCKLLDSSTEGHLKVQFDTQKFTNGIAVFHIVPKYLTKPWSIGHALQGCLITAEGGFLFL